jgi:hypothetical protein
VGPGFLKAVLLLSLAVMLGKWRLHMGRILPSSWYLIPVERIIL